MFITYAYVTLPDGIDAVFYPGQVVEFDEPFANELESSRLCVLLERGGNLDKPEIKNPKRRKSGNSNRGQGISPRRRKP